MAIIVSANADLELHVIRFEGAVGLGEFLSLGRLHQSRPEWAAADTIYIVEASEDPPVLSPQDQDALRQHYTPLYKSLPFHILRRSAWVCRNAAARKLVENWLKGRHSRDGHGTEFCLATDVKEIGPLVLRS